MYVRQRRSFFPRPASLPGTCPDEATDPSHTHARAPIFHHHHCRQLFRCIYRTQEHRPKAFCIFLSNHGLRHDVLELILVAPWLSQYHDLSSRTNTHTMRSPYTPRDQRACRFLLRHLLVQVQGFGP